MKQNQLLWNLILRKSWIKQTDHHPSLIFSQAPWLSTSLSYFSSYFLPRPFQHTPESYPWAPGAQRTSLSVVDLVSVSVIFFLSSSESSHAHPLSLQRLCVYFDLATAIFPPAFLYSPDPSLCPPGSHQLASSPQSCQQPHSAALCASCLKKILETTQ